MAGSLALQFPSLRRAKPNVFNECLLSDEVRQLYLFYIPEGLEQCRLTLQELLGAVLDTRIP